MHNTNRCFYSPSLEAGMPRGLILVNMTSSNGEVHTRGKMNVQQGEDQIAFHAPIFVTNTLWGLDQVLMSYRCIMGPTSSHITVSLWIVDHRKQLQRKISGRVKRKYQTAKARRTLVYTARGRPVVTMSQFHCWIKYLRTSSGRRDWPPCTLSLDSDHHQRGPRRGEPLTS